MIPIVDGYGIPATLILFGSIFLGLKLGGLVAEYFALRSNNTQKTRNQLTHPLQLFGFFMSPSVALWGMSPILDLSEFGNPVLRTLPTALVICGMVFWFEYIRHSE